MSEQMVDVVRRLAPWARDVPPAEVELVVRRALTMGLDPLNPSEVQIWKDERGKISFQIGYQLMEAWVKKLHGEHTQPRFFRLSSEELKAEGMAETTIAYRCEFVMVADFKAISEATEIFGREEALRMFTCIGLGAATQAEYNGAYFAPKGRSASWKVQKRALTDAYRRKFGLPTAEELLEVKRRLGFAALSAEDYELAEGLTDDLAGLHALAQSNAVRRALPPQDNAEMQALLYGDVPATPATPPAEPPVPEPAAEPAPAETLIEPPTPEPAAPEPAAAPATLSDARAEWSRVWNIAKRAGLKPPVLNGKWSIEEIVEHTEILRAEIAEAEAAASTPAAKES